MEEKIENIRAMITFLFLKIITVRLNFALIRDKKYRNGCLGLAPSCEIQYVLYTLHGNQ